MSKLTKSEKQFNKEVEKYEFSVITPLKFVKLLQIAKDTDFLSFLDEQNLNLVREKVEYGFDVNFDLKEFLRKECEGFNEQEYNNFLCRLRLGKFLKEC